MPRKRGDRLYKKRRRWYADFRDYKDVGGRQEALVRKGKRYGTTSRKVAVRLAKARMSELKRLRKAGHGGREDDLRRYCQLGEVGAAIERRVTGVAQAAAAALHSLKEPFLNSR